MTAKLKNDKEKSLRMRNKLTMNEKSFSSFADPRERKTESLPTFSILSFARHTAILTICIAALILSSCTSNIPEECVGVYKNEPVQSSFMGRVFKNQYYYLIDNEKPSPVVVTETSWEYGVREPSFHVESYEVIGVEEIETNVYKIILVETGKDGSVYENEIEINTSTKKLYTPKGSHGTGADKLELIWTSEQSCIDTKSDNKDCNPLWWQY